MLLGSGSSRKVAPRTRIATLTSQRLAVDQEARALGDLVVQEHRPGVRLVRLPVDPLGPGNPCPFVHRLDQRTADALAAAGLGGEEGLQIAGGPNQYGAAMEEIVDEADQTGP